MKTCFSTLLSSRKQRQWPLKRHSGITLVELSVVLAIIGVMAMVAIPRLKNWWPRMCLKKAGDDLYSAMQKAKIYAIDTNRDVIFNFTNGCSAAGKYAFKDSVSSVVVANATMADYSGACINSSFSSGHDGFSSHGLPLAGSAGNNVMVINAAAASYKYVITQSAGGGIRVEKK